MAPSMAKDHDLSTAFHGVDHDLHGFIRCRCVTVAGECTRAVTGHTDKCAAIRSVARRCSRVTLAPSGVTIPNSTALTPFGPAAISDCASCNNLLGGTACGWCRDGSRNICTS